ncbi:hypothetical protein Dimus_023850 [Dionaea muscipula]
MLPEDLDLEELHAAEDLEGQPPVKEVVHVAKGEQPLEATARTASESGHQKGDRRCSTTDACCSTSRPDPAAPRRRSAHHQGSAITNAQI